MTKICTKCNVEKDLEHFYFRKDFNLRRNHCKECVKTKVKKYKQDNYEKCRKQYKEAEKRKIKKDPLCRIKSFLKCDYNISLEEYNQQLLIQNGACYICKGIDKTRLCVDHCHKTNKIRGLLCMHCNQALGKFKDSVEFVERAAQYLLTEGVWHCEKYVNNTVRTINGKKA